MCYQNSLDIMLLGWKRKIHNTNHNGQCKITSPRSCVVGTKALSSFTTPMSSTSGLSLHRSSANIKSQQTIIHSNKIFKTKPQVQTLHATFLGYASSSIKWIKKHQTRNTQHKQWSGLWSITRSDTVLASKMDYDFKNFKCIKWDIFI